VIVLGLICILVVGCGVAQFAIVWEHVVVVSLDLFAGHVDRPSQPTDGRRRLDQLDRPARATSASAAARPAIPPPTTTASTLSPFGPACDIAAPSALLPKKPRQ